jgi:hypothetical protein
MLRTLCRACREARARPVLHMDTTGRAVPPCQIQFPATVEQIIQVNEQLDLHTRKTVRTVELCPVLVFTPPPRTELK